MCDVAARCGAEVVAVEHGRGAAGRRPAVLGAHPAPALYAAVHAETSTGVRSDIAALRAAKGDALLVTDAVTSIAGIELLADEWGIDVGYASGKKCLGVAPGLAPFTINDRAFARRVEKPRDWYLDLGLLGLRGRGVRRRPDLPPHGAGGDGRQPARGPDPDRRGGPRERLGKAPRGRPAAAGRPAETRARAVRGRGPPPPELTTVRVPDGVDSAAVRARLLERYDIEIGAGVGQYASTVWRIGLMGHNARPEAALSCSPRWRRR